MFPHTFVELVHESIVSGHNCNEILTILYSSYLKKKTSYPTIILQWRHNKCDGVSNHWRFDCLLNSLFRRRSMNTPKFRHWPLWGEFTGDRWIPAQRASNAENVSIWWHHHEWIIWRLYSFKSSIRLSMGLSEDFVSNGQCYIDWLSPVVIHRIAWSWCFSCYTFHEYCPLSSQRGSCAKTLLMRSFVTLAKSYHIISVVFVSRTNIIFCLLQYGQ